MISTLAFNSPLQHCKPPSSQILDPPDLMAVILLALRSQLRCPLLEENFHDPLHQSRAFSVLLPWIRNVLVCLSVDCLLSAPAPLEYKLRKGTGLV